MVYRKIFLLIRTAKYKSKMQGVLCEKTEEKVWIGVLERNSEEASWRGSLERGLGEEPWRGALEEFSATTSNERLTLGEDFYEEAKKESTR